MSIQKKSILFVVFNDEGFKSLRVYQSNELEIYIDKQLYKTVKTANEFWNTVLPNGLSVDKILSMQYQMQK